MSCAVIFGGAGFVGTFFAEHLLSSGRYSKVYLYDLQLLDEKPFPYRRDLLKSFGESLMQIKGDVRKSIEWTPDESVELIANFAAVHREPGHEDYEYYETNLLGAENVCAWAEKVLCSRLIFTSSISPYGASETVKDERTLPVPVTAYGGSKLAAEKIHQIWQAKDDARRLVIVRPGVVFGPGEGGNVSRLIKAVMNRYFFYMGNRSTRKAGVYVKELCSAMCWVLERQEEAGEHVSLFNMSMNPGPSIEEYVRAVCKVGGVVRSVPVLPYALLIAAAYAIELVAKPMRIDHPFSPVRIRKLVRSNNVLPSYLVEHGYVYKYTLESAFADWKQSCSEEWQ